MVSSTARTTATDARQPYWYAAGLALSLFMLCVHLAAGFNSAGVGDSWRDVYWATMIATGDGFPVSGPPIYSLLELGPWWFYILAIPVALTGTVVSAGVAVQLLAGAKYFIAWRLGTRAVDARFGLAWAGGLAIAGWSVIPILFPSSTAVVETTLLLLAGATWRCWQRLSIGNALLLGLASGACLHAHPTTASFIVVAGTALLVRHRSWAAFGALAAAAVLAALTLLPPLLDPAPTFTERTLKGYVGHDIAVDVAKRIPALLAAMLAGGAWDGFLLMTPWGPTTVRIAWFAYCACVVFALAGVFMLPRDGYRLRRIAMIAVALLLMQTVFLVLVRPVTPMWMFSTLLVPFALLLATGWYGWFAASRTSLRTAALAAFALFVALSIPPLTLFLKNLRSIRVAEAINPYENVIDVPHGYWNMQAPFYPARRRDKLASSFCEPAVVHGRLAPLLEQSIGAPTRLACGHWPELRYGGREGPAKHVAGLLARASVASGIAPDRVVAGMALYEGVAPIAPESGGGTSHLKRVQINPDIPTGGYQPERIEFDAKGADVPVLTNRFPLAMPLNVRKVTADGRPAQLLFDDGGSMLYRCAGCARDATVHWRFELEGNQDKLDLAVLNAKD